MIALNMIVKNEASILERCLRSVAPWIDYYVIGDTGSTDGTPELIQNFFRAREIDGEVHRFPFVDFGQARNEALDRCRRSPGRFDYILFADADMELVVDDAMFRDGLRDPAYAMRQVSSISYDNVRLVRRDVSARYIGPTHEFFDVAHPGRLSGVWFRDHDDGSSHGEKYERDVRLLQSFLEQHPNDARSMFYLAQTYRCQGEHQKAIEEYERRIAVGGWIEEVWYSHYRIADCHRALGDEASFVHRALLAYQLRPSRAEPLYLLANHYRLQGQNDLAVLMANMGRRIPMSNDNLFVEHSVYRHGFDEELSIAGFYSALPQIRNEAHQACMDLATRRELPEHVKAIATQNQMYYALPAERFFGPAACVMQIHARDGEAYRPMNPTIAIAEGRIRCGLRLVNYTVGENYRTFEEDGRVRTRNAILELSQDLTVARYADLVEPAFWHDVRRSDRVQGFEDCRLFFWRNSWWATATVLDQNTKGVAEIALIQIVGMQVDQVYVQRHPDVEPHLHQKNWMPLVRGDDLFLIYKSDPTTILRVDPETKQAKKHSTSTPPRDLSHLRGSSQALPIDGGWLYVAHEAFERDEGRRYTHRLVWLDDDFILRRMSDPFYFLHTGIEFCAGLAHLLEPTRDELVFTFGVHDERAHLMSFSTAKVLATLKEVR